MLEYCQQLKIGLSKRFAYLESDDLYLAAAALDPNMKLKWCIFASSGDLEPRVRMCLLDMMEKVKLLPPGQGNRVEKAKPATTSDLFGFMDTNDCGDQVQSAPAVTEHVHLSNWAVFRRQR